LKTVGSTIFEKSSTDFEATVVQNPFINSYFG
jgi:hypothetical protein